MGVWGDSEIGGGRRSFPTTHWSQLAAVQGESHGEHQAILNLLIERYWKPVYCYICRRGWDSEEAKDLVQEFFTSWLQKHLFGKADPSRGRFRGFLLSCLDNFLSNARRAQRAQRRRPAAGFLSIHQLASEDRGVIEPADDRSPEAEFHRVWLAGLLDRTLAAFERECRSSGKEAHFELFTRRIMLPATQGDEPPALAELASSLGLTEKEASNRLITARRAVQRLLREEVGAFAVSEEDAAAEVRDLFELLAGS